MTKIESRRIDGARVRQLREDLGLSQEKLAAQVGVSRPLIGMIESGVRPHPKGSTLLALGRALGVRPEDLYIGDGPDDDPVAVAERRLLARYQRLSARQQRRVDQMIDDMLGESRTEQP